MRYYTETIPTSLAEKLKEKGMPIEMQPLYAPEAPNARGIVKAGVGLWCPPYAEVFDWLMERGIDVEVALSMIIDVKNEGKKRVYFWTVGSLDNINYEYGEDDNMTWHEAANAAIEKALELIK